MTLTPRGERVAAVLLALVLLAACSITDIRF